MSQNGTFNSRKVSGSTPSSSTSETPTFPLTIYYSRLSGMEIFPLYNNDYQRNESSIPDEDKYPMDLDKVRQSIQKHVINQKQNQKQLLEQQSHQTRKISGVEVIPNIMNRLANPVRYSDSVRYSDPVRYSDLQEKSRKLFYCQACDKTFKFQTSLLRHNNKVHISKYQCQTCSRVFSRQAYLDVHVSKKNTSCYSGPGVHVSILPGGNNRKD